MRTLPIILSLLAICSGCNQKKIDKTPKQSPKFINYERFDGGKTSLDDLKGKIKKDLALEVFNHIYYNQRVNNIQLGRSLKLYGIRPWRSRTADDNNWYYVWGS